MAQAVGGRFLLRIEDIDLNRSREDHIRSIETDLAWLGVHWEQPVLRQSTRFDAYERVVDRLLADRLVYPCAATRSEILTAVAHEVAPALDPDGALSFPRSLRRHIAFKPGVTALRLDMPLAVGVARDKLGGRPLTFREITPEGRIETHLAQPERWGDVVIVRKELPASYHLAVVVDDATQGVTHVTRGRDLFAATDLHRLLQVVLGLPEPIYHHHRLVLGPDARKLSKSAGAPSLAKLRAEGVSVNQLISKTGSISPQNPTEWGLISMFEINML